MLDGSEEELKEMQDMVNKHAQAMNDAYMGLYGAYENFIEDLHEIDAGPLLVAVLHQLNVLQSIRVSLPQTIAELLGGEMIIAEVETDSDEGNGTLN